MDRPDRHNAFNSQLIHELTTIFQQNKHNREVRVIVLTGMGSTFSAGMDLGELDLNLKTAYENGQVEGQAIFALMSAVDSCPKPVIGRVNGSAIGGGLGLVSCCDIVLAIERAKFGFSEVRLGLIPAVISPFVISKIGSSRSRELFLTGRRFTAAEAAELGLVHQVVSEDQLDSAVEDVVANLLLGAPEAQAAIKRLVSEVADPAKVEKRGFVTDEFARRLASPEARAGIEAFLKGSKPPWQV